jgi:RNA polymerase sigma-70 factor (ECF subfamily)
MSHTAQIWKDYHSKLHGFIQSRVGDPSTADDILQDVFTRIHSRIDTLRNANKIRSWIYQITRNAIIDHYRAHRATEALPETLVAVEAEPSDQARQEIARCLVPMIQALPETYRQTMMMSEIEGLTQKQVAEKQGISVSGAKARVQRGRAKLRDMLLDCCQFQFDHRGRVMDYEDREGACGDDGIASFFEDLRLQG